MEITEDMGVKQLRLDVLTQQTLGIKGYKDVSCREDSETGDIYIISSSGLAREIEKLEQLKGIQ